MKHWKNIVSTALIALVGLFSFRSEVQAQILNQKQKEILKNYLDSFEPEWSCIKMDTITKFHNSDVVCVDVLLLNKKSWDAQGGFGPGISIFLKSDAEKLQEDRGKSWHSHWDYVETNSFIFCMSENIDKSFGVISEEWKIMKKKLKQFLKDNREAL